MIYRGHQIRLKQLICEGQCNPGIRELDAEVSQAIDYEGRPLSNASIIARQRALKYTEHEEIGFNTAMCGICVAGRKY